MRARSAVVVAVDLLDETAAPQRAPLPEEPARDGDVDGAHEEQDARGHGGADDRADALEAAPMLQLRGSRGDADAEQEHDGAVAEREVEADAQRRPPVRDELAAHAVDGREVVRVDGVAQAEGEREDARRHERGIARPDGRERAEERHVRSRERREHERGAPARRPRWDVRRRARHGVRRRARQLHRSQRRVRRRARQLHRLQRRVVVVDAAAIEERVGRRHREK